MHFTNSLLKFVVPEAISQLFFDATMNVCYQRSFDPCVYTFEASDLLVSLPDQGDSVYPPISLQLGCNPGFDISGFNILPQFINPVSSHGTVISPSVVLAASASFHIGLPQDVGDIDACICILDICTKQGLIRVRGVFRLPDPVVCLSNCFFSLQSVFISGSNLDLVALIPLPDGVVLSANVCNGLMSAVSFSPTLVFSEYSSLNVLMLTRSYQIDSSMWYSGGEYLICFCAMDSNACSLGFPMYVGLLYIISSIHSISVFSKTSVRITPHQFSLFVHRTDFSSDLLNVTCAIGSSGVVAPSTSDEILSCTFTECIFESSMLINDQISMYYQNGDLPDPVYVWCVDMNFPTFIFPPAGYPLLVVDGMDFALQTYHITAYISVPISFPALLSSMGQYKLSTNSTDCFSRGMESTVGQTCPTNTSACILNSDGVWSLNLTTYGLCYCDQITIDNECISWDIIGDVAVIGPNIISEYLYFVDPSESLNLNLTVNGTELSLYDQIALFEGLDCLRYNPNWYTPIFVQNDSLVEFFSIILPPTVNMTYSVCWCATTDISGMCVFDPIQQARVIVSNRVDCVVSAWTVSSVCSSACGGGTRNLTRSILDNPSGGGLSCPTNMESTSVCNTQACPPVLIDSLTISSDEIKLGLEFFLTISGKNLRPLGDFVWLKNTTCDNNEDFVGNIVPCNIGIDLNTTTAVKCGNITLTETSFAGISVYVCYCSSLLSTTCASNKTAFNIQNGPFRVEPSPTASTSTSHSSTLMWSLVSFGFALCILVFSIIVCKRPKAVVNTSIPSLSNVTESRIRAYSETPRSNTIEIVDILSAPPTPTFPDERYM